MRRSLAVAALLAALFAAGLAAQPAGAAVAAPGTASAAAYGGSAAGNAALNWAEHYATGHPYVYGAAGPYAYDCSGLVMAAFAHGAGVSLPHSTYAMLSSPRLHRIPLSEARRGDLLFYGSGHVEIDTIWHDMSYGAQHSGTLVGWHHWGYGWVPTMAFRVF